MPKASETFTTWQVPIGKQAIVASGHGHISLNPWAFRDRVLRFLEGNKRIYKDETFPLLQEIRLFERHHSIEDTRVFFEALVALTLRS